jgi:hypothetical protein
MDSNKKTKQEIIDSKINDIIQNKPNELRRLMSFLEAEGSLFGVLRIQKGRSFFYRFTLSANIANMDKPTIIAFRYLLGCGTIRQQIRQKVIWYWEIASIEEIHNFFIPLIKKLPWQTEKLKHDFELFVKINELLNSDLIKDIPFLLNVLALRNRFKSRRSNGPGTNDKKTFEKLLTFLEKQCEESSSKELIFNIQVLKDAIQTLNTQNKTVWGEL